MLLSSILCDSEDPPENLVKYIVLEASEPSRNRPDRSAEVFCASPLFFEDAPGSPLGRLRNIFNDFFNVFSCLFARSFSLLFTCVLSIFVDFGSFFNVLWDLSWDVFGVLLGSSILKGFSKLSECLKILSNQLSLIIFLYLFRDFGYLSETLVKYNENDTSDDAPGAPLDALWQPWQLWSVLLSSLRATSSSVLMVSVANAHRFSHVF